jgi:uncharacterized SAM-binding protein YcdF (DUF218 family)
MSFLYAIFLKLLYPTSLCVILLLAAAVFRQRQRVRRLCFGLAVASLVVCGNGWVVEALGRHLEWQYLPPHPVPQADCILVLGGGTAAAIAPRSTVEIGEAGDRLLYAAHLFRQGRAPWIICTSGIATGGLALRPPAHDMAEVLGMMGASKEAILLETKSGNTREHARNLDSLFQEKKFMRVLLVTSAMHMPRSLGVFKKRCPGIEFIPAPTDFRFVERIPAPWYREVVALVPTPSNLALFSEVMHEYLGMAYYRMRGWM